MLIYLSWCLFTFFFLSFCSWSFLRYILFHILHLLIVSHKFPNEVGSELNNFCRFQRSFWIFQHLSLAILLFLHNLPKFLCYYVSFPTDKIGRNSYVIMRQDFVQGGCPQPSFAYCEHGPAKGYQATHWFRGVVYSRWWCWEVNIGGLNMLLLVGSTSNPDGRNNLQRLISR